ncbi:sensor histidine kinase [Leeia aquatica]|uniref:HAMP domain-containing histidine kinase n=1 Tax=Leeia aquatica TaxID=2725557 RepID=A0A847S9D2_9NEIS|nr:HAMP domain-containing histidine kinase [Leeia aquatica]NLR76614.1 HAMP domain-containing histidine kinase [Leeia aquatica]
MAQLIHALLASAVHENKNLMQTVLAQIEQLTQDPRASDLQDELQVLRRQATRLVDSSLEVLAIYHAGLDADDFRLDYNTVPLEEWLLELQAEAQEIIGERPLQLEALMDSEVPLYWIFDASLLRLALRNGLHNAADFARSRIRLTLTLLEGRLCISIEDDGVHYGNTDRGPSRPAASGIGLLLADTLLRAHHDKESGRHGEIRLERAPELGGGAFRCLLP